MAEKVGELDDIVLDAQQCCVSGLVVAEGRSFLGAPSKRWLQPASTIVAVGPDAITVKNVDRRPLSPRDDSVLLLSAITGRKMVTERGQLLGTLTDVLLRELEILGYAFSEEPRLLSAVSSLQSLVMGKQPERVSYVRAVAGLRIGERLIVAPDDAIVRNWPLPQTEDFNPVERLGQRDTADDTLVTGPWDDTSAESNLNGPLLDSHDGETSRVAIDRRSPERVDRESSDRESRHRIA